MILLKFSFILSLFFSLQLSAKDQLFGSCHIVDKQNKLFKCKQIGYKYLNEKKQFHANCLTRMPYGYRTYFYAKACPQKKLKYACLKRKSSKTQGISEFYYYTPKKIKEIKSYCLHTHGKWGDLDPQSQENLFLKSDIKSLTCVRYQDFKPLYCETMKSDNPEQLKSFLTACQINHPRGRYYKFLKNSKCPTQEKKYSCLSKGNEFIFYEYYKAYKLPQLEKVCQTIKESWRSRSLNAVDFREYASASCQTSIKGEMVFCDEMQNTGKEDFVDFFKSCRVASKDVRFLKNTPCPQKGVKASCLGNKMFKRNRYLYSSDQRKMKLLKYQCESSKLNWKRGN